MRKIAVLGDIHACLAPLTELIEPLLSTRDELVFLGDYVDRGPDSSGVIEALLNLNAANPGRMHFLAGNHDRELLRVLNGDSIDTLLRMGGAPTVLSYVSEPFGDVVSQLRLAVPESHLAFLESLADTFVLPGLIACHEKPNTLIEAFAIYGHTVQTSLEPKFEPNAVSIDTGCGTLAGGRLTAISWPELTWVQSASWDGR